MNRAKRAAGAGALGLVLAMALAADAEPAETAPPADDARSATRQAERNRAPLARIGALPTEVRQGEVVEFDATASVDPDARPSPLRFEWRFGDAATAAQARTRHRYAEPGVYDVELVVDDGDMKGIATHTLYVLARPYPGASAQGSALALAEADATLWVVNTDSGSVTAIDTRTARKRIEIEACKAPGQAALDASRERLYVTCSDANQVAVFDTRARARIGALDVGHRPHGVVVAPKSGLIVVTNTGSDDVSVIDPSDFGASGSPSGAAAGQRRIAVRDGPRGVAVDAEGEFAYVSHFISRGPFGLVTRIHLSTGATHRITLRKDTSPDTASSGGGRPNLLDAIVLDAAGRRVWVGGQKSNIGAGLVRSGAPLVATNRVRALLAPIDVESGRERAAARLDANNADHVSAIALTPGDRYAILAHRGSGRVSIYDLLRVDAQVEGATSDGAALPFESRFDVGHAPTALALTRDGATLYVLNSLSRSVSVFDVRDVRAPRALAEVPVSAEPLPPVIARGKQLFNRSRAPEHAVDDYIACWSCHPDGGMDGLTWDLTQYGEGLRNTIDLRGRGGLAHGPLHWSANFDEVQDLELDIVRAFGGTGLAADGAPPHPPLGAARNAGRSADLDALAAYVSSLAAAPPSPHRAPDGALTQDAVAGRAIFESARTGCTQCHVAPRFTDSAFEGPERQPRLHDVGTLTRASGLRLGAPLTGLDTPTLLGVWDTAPYLHDGSARSLDDVVGTRNREGRHGHTAHLTDTQRTQLVRYLLALDARDAAAPR